MSQLMALIMTGSLQLAGSDNNDSESTKKSDRGKSQTVKTVTTGTTVVKTPGKVVRVLKDGKWYVVRAKQASSWIPSFHPVSWLAKQLVQEIVFEGIELAVDWVIEYLKEDSK